MDSEHIALYMLLALSLIVFAEAWRSHSRVRRELRHANELVPVDQDTGLIRADACEFHLTGELKRVLRFDGSLQLAILVAADGDQVGLGRRLAEHVEFPVAGFRLADRVFALAVADYGDDEATPRLEELVALCRGPGTVSTTSCCSTAAPDLSVALAQAAAALEAAA